MSKEILDGSQQNVIVHPEFVAHDLDGKEVRLSHLIQNGPVLLVLLRGFT